MEGGEGMRARESACACGACDRQLRNTGTLSSHPVTQRLFPKKHQPFHKCDILETETITQ